MDAIGQAVYAFGYNMYEAVLYLSATLINNITGMKMIDFAEFTAVTSAIGVTLTSLFFAMQIISQVGLSRFDGNLEDVMKLAFKFIIAKIIIENSSGIVGGIYNLFFEGQVGDFGSQLSSTVSTIKAAELQDVVTGGFMGMGWLIGGLLLTIIDIAFGVLFIKLIIQIAGIYFEIGIHVCVAPIALSTLCNDTARSAGISFIKSYTAVCMQILVMKCCLTVCNKMFDYLRGGTAIIRAKFTELGVTGDMIKDIVVYDIIKFISPLLMTLALTTAISKSGELTKRMLGA